MERQLPDWWSRDVEDERGAITELKLRLSRRLSIDLKQLLERNAVAFALPDAVRFKRTMQVNDTPVNEPYLAYALAVARSVAAALPGDSIVPFADPLKERLAILEDTNVRWLSLNALLRRCWEDLGIAVVQLRDAPKTGKGFDAASFRIDGRYIVVLAKLVTHPARSAFFLAHELGHIAREDLKEGQAILDDEPDFDAPKGDDEETAANAYALSVLGGKTTTVQVLGEPNAASLAATALSVGESLRIDPGHLVLRYGHESNNWEVTQAALRRLAPERDAADTVNSIALRLLDFSNVGDDVGQLVIDALTWHG